MMVMMMMMKVMMMMRAIVSLQMSSCKALGCVDAHEA
jgi:hypothetical protein